MAAEPVTVIFRKFRDTGQVIALFPCIPADTGDLGLCLSYMHVGQHAAATPLLTADGSTVPAMPAEYAALKRELESPPYGYRLSVRRRMPPDAYEQRWDALRRSRSPS
jgi:hypothetical protein